MKGGMGKEEMENARRAMEDNVGSEGSKGGGVGAETGKDKCIERSHKRERERERERERSKTGDESKLSGWAVRAESSEPAWFPVLVLRSNSSKIQQVVVD